MNVLIYTGASVFEGLLWYRAGGPPACGIFYFMQPSQLDKKSGTILKTQPKEAGHI